MGLGSIPPGVLENIASSLDNTSLCAMHATSRTIKLKSLYAYLTNCFVILKFCLNPASLQALTNIFDTPELTFYVRTVAFGTVSVSRSWFIDPLYNEAVKRRDTKHPPSTTPATTLDELKKVRQRIDAVIIAEALAKIPRLEAVMLGRDLQLNGHPVRPSWGRYSVNGVRFECPSNLSQTDNMLVSEDTSVMIKYVFTTVCMALEQLQQQDIDIHLGLGDHDYFRIKVDRHSLSTWYPSPIYKDVSQFGSCDYPTRSNPISKTSWSHR